MKQYKIGKDKAVSTLGGVRYKSIDGIISIDSEADQKELEKRFKIKPIKEKKEVNEDG